MRDAGNRQTAIQQEASAPLHMFYEGIPQRITTLIVICGLCNRQGDSIAEDVESSTRTRERYYQAILVVQEANVETLITADKRKEDYIIFLALVSIHGDDLEDNLPVAKYRSLSEQLKDFLALSSIEL